MGRHYKRKESLIKILLKLALLAVVSFMLLFVLCRQYPDKFSPALVRQIDIVALKAADLRSKAAVILFGGEEGAKVIIGSKPVQEAEEEEAALSEDVPVTSGEPVMSEDKRPMLAIVVDDGGNDLSMAKKAANFDLPLTWAILPYTRYAAQTAELADTEEIPYLLHLPMQAEIDKDPKAYLVGEGMDRGKIREITAKAIDSLPSPIGINNHRGSLATSKWDIMVPVIDILKERELCFLDSRTSGKSVAYEAAKAAGIQAFKNRGFLDGTPDKDSIRARFEQAVKTAEQKGDMIVICHFRPATFLFLEDLNERYKELPVRLVTLPQMGERQKEKEGEEEQE